MTLPVSGSPIVDHYTRLWSSIITVQSDCLNIQQQLAAGPCSLQWFGQLAQDILQFNSNYDACTATQTMSNAIIAWAQQQNPGTTFAGQDFVNTYNAAQTLLTDVEQQYPTANGYLADRQWNAASGVTWSTVMSDQIPAITSAISAFLATLS